MTTTESKLSALIGDKFERNDRDPIHIEWEQVYSDAFDSVRGHYEYRDGERGEIQFDDQIIVTIPNGFGPMSEGELDAAIETAMRYVAARIVREATDEDFDIQDVESDEHPVIDFDQRTIMFPLRFTATAYRR